MTFKEGVQQALRNIAVMICGFSGVNATFGGTDGIDRRWERGAIALYGSERERVGHGLQPQHPTVHVSLTC